MTRHKCRAEQMETAMNGRQGEISHPTGGASVPQRGIPTLLKVAER
jgi:hypothetical protein